VFSIKTGGCVSEGPQQIEPQEELEGDDQPVQCPEGTVFVPGAGCRQPPVAPGDEADQEPTQCPEGTVFSIKTGGCVSEGPQQIEPQEEAVVPEDEEQEEQAQPIVPLEEAEEPEDEQGDLLSELRGGLDTKEGGNAGEAEESGGGGDDNISPEDLRGGEVDKMAPVAISGNNVYVVWWTNDTTGNNEVNFRASTDGGQTFGDKINLSNTTNANSTRAEIDSGANSVVVTWWETTQTDDTPLMRVSDDNGATFGPVLMLGANGTIGVATEDEGEEEG
jgi:hypothetical protein